MDGREAIERRVEARLARALPAVDLLELSVAGGRGSGTLRLVVDHPDGVDHGVCEAVTRALEEDGLLDLYGIEVWSPGPEPPLRTPEHFRRAVGRRVRVRAEAADGVRSRSGTLVSVDGSALSIADGEAVVEIPLSAVRRARLLEDPGDAG